MPVEVPIPRDPVEEERQRMQQPALWPKAATEGLVGQLAKGLYDFKVPGFQSSLGSGLAAIDPVGATSPTAKWWHAPAMLGTGVAAGVGGWKLVDWLADKRRDQAGDADLNAAKQEYEDAVRGLHAKTAGLDAARATMQKNGWIDGPPASFIKSVNDTVSKAGPAAAAAAPAAQATIDPIISRPWAPNAAKNYAGLSGNALMGLAALAAIPTGVFAYQHARNNTDAKALQEALMARRRAQQLRNPAPPHLVLQPAG